MICRHSLSELAFQTACRNHGKMCAKIHQTARIERMVRMALSQLENRLALAQPIAPTAEPGGSSAGSRAVRL